MIASRGPGHTMITIPEGGCHYALLKSEGRVPNIFQDICSLQILLDNKIKMCGWVRKTSATGSQTRVGDSTFEASCPHAWLELIFELARGSILVRVGT